MVLCNYMLRIATAEKSSLVGSSFMSLIIDGIEFVTATELLRELSISRQTLWRWRQQRSISLGRLYRKKKLVFTVEEALAIRDFANRLEPVSLDNPSQLRLFARGTSRVLP